MTRPKFNINPLEIVQVILLLLFMYLFNEWKGPALAVLIFMVWLDKNLFSRLKFQGEFGIELQTLSSVLAGIMYGPIFGFFFGFLVWTFIGGLFELISWMIVPPYAPSVYPFLPSPDTLLNGFLGAIAGFTGTSMTLILLMAIVSIIRNVIIFLKDQLYGWPPKFAYALNIIFNVALVLAFQPYFDMMINSVQLQQ